MLVERTAVAALPNLLVIGSAKSGTTSLHRYLDCHPEISMAAPRGSGRLHDNDAEAKEMRFFWREDWRERLDWYSAHFSAMSTPVRGEVTPAYSAHPFHPGVPERIHSVLPRARLLYIVRDPIDRIVSHYVQERADGDRRTFEQRMAECDVPENSIVCPSRYATQLERYLALFADEQIMVIDQNELRHERRATLRRIFEFVGVSADFWSPEFERERNVGEDKYALTRSGRVLFERLLDPAARRLAPRAWTDLRPRVRRALSEPLTERPIVSSELRERLSQQLGPEVERLRALTGESFAAWSL